MRAARRTLLGVVHAGVDAQLLDGVGSRRGYRLADGEIGRSGTLHLGGAELRGAAHAGVVHHPGRGDLAGALAVEKIAGIDAVQEKGVAGVPLAVGPDRHVAEAGVDAGAARKFRVDSGRENGEPGEAAGRKRSGLDLIFFEDVAVGGIGGVEEGRGLDGDCGTHLADLESDVEGGGAVSLHDDRGNFFGLKTVVGEGKRIGTDGQVHKIVASEIAGLGGAGKLGRVGDQGDRCRADGGAGRVDNRAVDAAERLRARGRSEQNQ